MNRLSFEEWFDATFKKDFTFIDGARSWAKAGWDAALQPCKHPDHIVGVTDMIQPTQNLEKKCPHGLIDIECEKCVSCAPFVDI